MMGVGGPGSSRDEMMTVFYQVESGACYQKRGRPVGSLLCGSTAHMFGLEKMVWKC